ncbi:MAG: hypothetical protein IJN82_07630 [Clostridia bacterium]|nr:hypothetical protein [Clostridia bacterium]
MMPVGDVNVLWYNQTLAGQLKLADPQTLWRQGKWDWNGFKSFVTSVPATANGKALYAYQQSAADMMNAWPLTNSMAPVWIDPKSRDASLINNWTDERTLSAWEFISDTVQKIQFGCSYSKLYEDGTLMMADTEVLQPFRKDHVYSKDVRYRWVPFPSAPNEMGKCIALGGGKAMMLPKKTADKTNTLYAAKFMELWATRFTEAMQDYFATADCIDMNHSEWKEYYDFVRNNTCFSLQMNEWDMLSEEGIAAKDAWFKALTDPSLNIRTESKAFEEYVRQAIDLCLAYDA